MKSLRLFVLLLPFVASAQTVQNPSFETAVTFSGSSAEGSWSENGIPGWSGSGGIFLPSASEFTSLPNGMQVAYLNGGTISQVVQVSAGTVTLTVQQGSRNDGYGAAASCTASLLAGSTVLGSANQANSAIPKGTWMPLTVTATAPAGPLTISLSSSGQQCDFDNVVLSAGSPPPFVWVMPGLGTATFPMQIPPACGPSDGTCSIQIQVCDTSKTPPVCMTASQGTITLLKNVMLPAPQQQAIPLVTVTP